MVNRRLFQTGSIAMAPKADTVNLAGGSAYNFNDEHSLCQFVVTGTFNGVFYANEGEQLDKLKTIVNGVNSEVIAKAAIYGAENAKMKDLPAYLTAVLAARGELELLRKVFPRVIVNFKMLSNFVTIIRSGQTGRKSFGTAVKRLIKEWIASQSDSGLFKASIGHSNPTMGDIIKMAHPRPDGQYEMVQRNELYRYLIGKTYHEDNLPPLVREFEVFKRDGGKVPNVPFRALTNCNLTPEHWKKIALSMPVNTLRMNLNMLARNKVFDSQEVIDQLAAKLSDKDEILQSRILPYQLLTTYQNLVGVPQKLSLAVQDALEHATFNVPKLGENVAVCIDTSGSMGSPVTGFRGSVTTETTCLDVASLMASCFARTNPNCKLVGWASLVDTIYLNPRDSVVTNSEKIGNYAHRLGGGTQSKLGLELLNKENFKGDVVIYISDNQSWITNHSHVSSYYNKAGEAHATEMMEEWAKFKRRNRTAKLVCIDIQPYTNSQAPNTSDILNIGGFSDSVWTLIERFVNNSNEQFADVVRQVKL